MKLVNSKGNVQLSVYILEVNQIKVNELLLNIFKKTNREIPEINLWDEYIKFCTQNHQNKKT